MFIVFACFRHCRPILCVDATHLKTRYNGQLFIAVGVDPCDRLFPVAYGIAEHESNDAWTYFMTHLKEAITGLHDEPVAFVSDRHKSIRNALQNVFPDSYHGVCYHHLKRNMKAKYKDNFPDDIFYDAAYAYSETAFNRHFANLKQQCPEAHAQLEKIGVEKWARAKFPGKRYAIMTSNYAESFNNVIRGARRWPVTSLLEFIRATLQKWFYKRREEAFKCETLLAKDIDDIVVAYVKGKKNFHVNPIDMYEFDVLNRSLKRGTVNLREKKCYCGYWQAMEIPCPHAVVAGAERRIPATSLCSRYYKQECYKHIYERNIYPIPDREEWDVPEGIKNKIVGVPSSRYAPTVSGQARRGRIRTSRIPSAWEEQPSRRVCSNCGHPGHYRVTCTQYRDGLE